ncbi:MAG: type II toxin-antitoxin system RelE/ParE family toxin [Chloroflexi bacterium]|nr:type II toxin-antitoxin system RelE/ParE family toxin [Chloroflexota bacterium]
MNRCEFTPDARSDLQQIHDYIAQGSPANALRFIDRLADNPYMGRARPEFGLEHRSFAVPNTRYVIIYRPIDAGVEIIHVRQGSQHLRRLFE